MSAASEFVDKQVPGLKAEGDIEAGGFLLSAKTVAELRGLEPFTRGTRIAPRVLVVARDGLPVDTELVAGLRKSGTTLDLRRADGFAGIMQPRHNAVLPEPVLATVLDWFDSCHSERTDTTASGFSPFRAGPALQTTRWREHRLFFGPADGLFGILTEPTTPAARDRPAVILLNMGSTHRVGCNNLSVRFARNWATRGFTVLRFDQGGIGDSLVNNGSPQNVPYSEHALDDIRAAVDLCITRGARRVVLAGLCSGAYHAYRLAIDLPMVCGAILINTLTFQTRPSEPVNREERHRRFHVGAVQYYRKALFRRETWLKALRGKVRFGRIIGILAARVQTLAKDRLERIFHTQRDEVAHNLTMLNHRGVDLLLVYGGDDSGLDLIRKKAGPALAELSNTPGFQLTIIHGADHTFTPLWAQRELEAVLTEHLEHRFA